MAGKHDAAGKRLDVVFEQKTPEGDERPREVCGHCGFIHYRNPKIVTGAVVYSGDRYLLCRRAIEPRVGYWTLPAGFMELSETLEEGACREVHEEALARIEIDCMLATYSLPHISQVQVFFRATLIEDGQGAPFAAGPESQDVGLYTWEEIPWNALAFPSVHWALKQARSVEGKSQFPLFGVPEEDAKSLARKRDALLLGK